MPLFRSKAIFLLTTLVLLFSCGSPEIKITKDMTYEPPLPLVENEYLLGPGDIIEIVYHVIPKPNKKPYILSVGDVIKVEFTYHPDINRKLTILPDGSITLPRKGKIFAAGLTVTQLQEKLTKIYSDIFRDPLITITMVKYNTTIYSLRKAITTAPRGQSKLTAIRPDGYISFPMINDIKASGMTLPQLKEIVSKEYGKIIDNLKITLILKYLKNNVVYVMGEVEKPNYYLMQGPTTVMQAISMAGGLLDSAERSTVIVIRLNKQHKGEAKLVDLNKVIAEGNIGLDILLKQYDIVYVPKSRIAKADVWVDQHINKIIPECFRAVFSVSDRVDVF